jgi:MFS family permease
VQYWRWLQVVVAALAMVATLPGRTHGLGLITVPLLRDLHLDETYYANLNLWATLLGAAFCVPWGWLLDRLGTRLVLTVNLLALGGVVVAMSGLGEASAVPWLFVLIFLTRALGQSALSVTSLALVGKAAGRRSGLAIGVYSFLVALGFMTAFGAVRQAFERWQLDWHSLWADMGWVLVGSGVVAWFLVRDFAPTAQAPEAAAPGRESYALGQALVTPAFWVFALASSYYGLVAAGISLFNQAILEERGFDRGVFLTIATFTPLVGLASNLATGWLAERWPLPRLLALAMGLLMVALLTFPHVRTLGEVYGYATIMGVVGGMITTLFFAVWGRAYGPVHLGKIQGAAQLLTVLASAVGPRLLTEGKVLTGSYIPVFEYGSVVAGLLAVGAWCSPLPGPRPATSTDCNPSVLLSSPLAGEGQGGG